MNQEREAKRRKLYAQKLAAYRRSETFKIVEARSRQQCEYWIPAGAPIVGMVSATWSFRCPAYQSDGFTLHHHHKTYARFGGKELPEDIIVLCERHHAEAEAEHPTRKRWQAHVRRGDAA